MTYRIGIDIGTTAYELSCCIKNIEDLSVITASVPVVNELMDYPNINLICTGGEVSSTDRSLIGHNAIRTINEYVLDKAFIGVAGVSLNLGLALSRAKCLSCLFVSWLNDKFLSLVILCSAMNYVAGLVLGSSENQKTRKLTLIISCVFSLGLLGVFKYFNFSSITS